ncbi:hypothetical protein LG302_07410 [Halomonas organivorans]
MPYIRLVALGLALAVCATPAIAMDQSSFEAAQERAAMLDRVRNLLADDSTSVRLAVFEEVMKDDDPVLRSMAMEAAFSGDDDRLKTAGLRQLIEAREFLAVELIEPRDPSQAQAYTYDVWRELVLKELKLDPSSDEIQGRFDTARSSNRPFIGQLTRGGWRLQLDSGHFRCHLGLSELSGVDLMGSLECAITGRASGDDRAGANRVTLPFRIRLS